MPLRPHRALPTLNSSSQHTQEKVMFIKNAWYIAAWAHEVKDKPFARTICNEAIVMYRDAQSGKVGALEDRCCHRGTPLRSETTPC